MKKALLALALAFTSMSAFSQSVASMKADAFIAKGDADGAIAVLKEAIDKVQADYEKKLAKKPDAQIDTKKMAEYYNKMGEVYAKVFNPQLMQAANQLPMDTATFMTALDGMTESFTKSVVYDNTPDAKGKVTRKYQASNAYYLNSMIPYYNYAAMFQYNNKNLSGASDCFKKYVEFLDNPVFTKAQRDSIYNAGKENYEQAAFNMVLISYQAKEWDKVLDMADVTVKNTQNESNIHDVYIMKQQACLEKGDTARWLNTLTDAIRDVKNNSNFMEQLVYYYNQHNDAAGANKMVDDLLAKDPNAASAWYMKGCVQLNLEKKFTEARASFEKAIELNPDFKEAHLNLAYTYMNQVMDYRQKGKYKLAFKKEYTKSQEGAYKKELSEIQSFYKKAKPHVEKVREMDPENVKLWGNALSQIYTNLNMKKEAEEVDDQVRASYKK